MTDRYDLDVRIGMMAICLAIIALALTSIDGVTGLVIAGTATLIGLVVAADFWRLKRSRRGDAV